MTNTAVLDILNHLCNEARNSVHATFGMMELLPPTAADPGWQTYLDISRSSADRLLRSIDDFRDLLSTTSVATDTVEEFDLALCLGETIDMVNLASGNPASRILLEAPSEPLPVRQHRRSFEQVLTRILDSILKLTPAGDVCVTASLASSPSGVRFLITPQDSETAVRVADWLNADPDQVSFRDLPGMPYALAVMVAGKGLRTLHGSVQVAREPGVPTGLDTFLPSLSTENRRQPEAGPTSLNVLLTEDCDDSFALTELLLQKENVWRARDGRQAIEMVQKQRFDVVLMDIHMDGMDGYTVIQAIREWETQSGNARTPIVVLSSDDLETQRQFAARCGCSGFLRKPLHSNDLPELIDRLRGARALTT
jgi:CheY-like chemotaxis protein